MFVGLTTPLLHVTLWIRPSILNSIIRVLYSFFSWHKARGKSYRELINCYKYGIQKITKTALLPAYCISYWSKEGEVNSKNNICSIAEKLQDDHPNINTTNNKQLSSRYCPVCSVYYGCLIINEAIAPDGVVSHFMRSYFLITPLYTTELTIRWILYTEQLKDGAAMPDTVSDDYEYDTIITGRLTL